MVEKEVFQRFLMSFQWQKFQGFLAHISSSNLSLEEQVEEALGGCSTHHQQSTHF
jgi:hypothetical protein